MLDLKGIKHTIKDKLGWIIEDRKFILTLICICICCITLIITLGKLLSEKEYIAIMERDLNDTMDYVVELQQEVELMYDEVELLMDQNSRIRKLDSANPEELIRVACKKYEIDPKLAIAIARLETGNFTSVLYKQSFNLGGMTGPNGYYEYSNMIEGVNAFVKMLKYGYIDKGMDTPEKMNEVYASSKSWARKVSQLMNQIQEEEDESLYIQ